MSAPDVLISDVDTDAPDDAERVVSRARLEARLDELRAEHDNGRAQLTRLAQQHDEMTATLGRITGAITVLEELLAPDRPTAVPPAP